MFQELKTEWAMMWNTGTIIWSRIKLTVGLVGSAITQSGVDLSTVITNQTALFAIKVGFALVALDGITSEAVRRTGTVTDTATATLVDTNPPKGG